MNNPMIEVTEKHTYHISLDTSWSLERVNSEIDPKLSLSDFRAINGGDIGPWILDRDRAIKLAKSLKGQPFVTPGTLKIVRRTTRTTRTVAYIDQEEVVVG